MKNQKNYPTKRGRIYSYSIIILLMLAAGCDSITSPDTSINERQQAIQSPGQSSSFGQAGPTFSNPANRPDIVEGHYIIVLSDLPGRDNPGAVAALEALSKEVGNMQGARVKHTYKHALTGFSAELTYEQAEKMRKDPRVQSVEQDRYVYTANGSGVQEHPGWGLDRIDQRGAELDRVYSYTGTGKGVTAYIIDSGIRYSHVEFGGRAVLGYDFVLEENPSNTDPAQGPGEDCSGHGTHVAGTVGGVKHGVAKEVDLVSVRVFGCTGGSPRSRVIAAIDWVTQDALENDRFPALTNMSLGGGYNPDDLSYEVAIGNSTASGINFIVAAMNWDNDACNYEPARNPQALTVGASSFGDERASFSNYGECVDLYAPGHGIASASHFNDTDSRTLSGTSMASPHVAGVVAMYLEDNQQATPAEVHSAIVNNTTQYAVSDVPYGPGNMVYSLWSSVSFTAPATPDLMLEAHGFIDEEGYQVIDLTWNAESEPFLWIHRNGAVIGHALSGSSEFRDKTPLQSENGEHTHQICEIAYDNCSEEVTTVFGNGEYTFDFNLEATSYRSKGDNIVELRWNRPLSDQIRIYRDGNFITTWSSDSSFKESPGKERHVTYVYKICEEDNYLTTPLCSEEVAVIFGNGSDSGGDGGDEPNAPPTADFTYQVDGLTVQFTDASTDSDGSITAWNWSFGDGTSSTAQHPSRTYAADGTYTVSLTVTDNDGGTGTTSKNVTVSSEDPPPPPPPGEIELSAEGYKVQGRWRADLSWTPAGTSANVDVYRDGNIVATAANTGSYTDITDFRGGGSLTYKVCEAGTETCSNEVTVQF
jgi:subtilisin family serine protease/PKD repeat protein